ncbi:MAG: extracellular solute-binding protein [Deltaproteobacteria bacterium]|nr:extracellular solute-binding protein [Deltaproteobacteria bacterium]MBW2138452.1 extracellular solute-binding protein [Deltaproteobacteria bacterium]
MVFAGSASKPPTEEASRLFERKTGIGVDLTFGGSGYVLSQMMLAKAGDIYFPGSSDYMERAKRRGVVFPGSERIVVYLVPSINVQRRNPKRIKSLKDLTRPGVRVAIANPDGVCVGAYAVEIIEKNMTYAEKAALRKNVVNYTGSCAKTAAVISLKMVDAVIGWRVFEYWDPERIETIPLDRSEIVRLGYIPIAISRYAEDRDLARRYIEFMLSREAATVFKRFNYFSTPEEAFAWIGESKPIGGEYQVPGEWLSSK